jgi:hypothetical protein
MRRALLVVLGGLFLGLGQAWDAVAGQEGTANPPSERRAGRAGEGPRAGAQAPPRQGPAGRQPVRRGGPMTPQQLDQAFDRFMITQARNALQLSDQQHRALGPRLERLQAVRRRAQRQRRQLVSEVNTLTQGAAPIDDATVAAKLKAIEDQNAQADAEIRRAYDAIDAVLTPAQRLRFRAFEVRMEQRKLELIARAQQRPRPPADPAASPPPQ